MSVRSSVRAMPALLRIGFAEAVAYRAEMFVWILATTMPLVMLALWVAVAKEAPVGRFGQSEFISYFLVTFIVRQVTSSWAGWQMNFEVRHGTLSMRLLKPLPPIVAYGVEQLAYIPMRSLLSLPVAAIAVYAAGPSFLPRDPLIWLLFVVSLIGGWLISFLSQFVLGTLSFLIQSSLKVMEVWFAAFMLLSGYLFPLELLPSGVRTVLDFLPFRYQIGLPVELANSLHDRTSALMLVGFQWLWVGGLCALSALMWRVGLRRFAAFGG